VLHLGQRLREAADLVQRHPPSLGMLPPTGGTMAEAEAGGFFGKKGGNVD